METSKIISCYFIVILLVTFSFYRYNANNKNKKHPNAGLNIEQFLSKYSYPLETHKVTTEDGYRLILHRIPHGRSECRNKGEKSHRIPVLFMHGVLQSSIDCVILGPDKSLCLLLADRGYDVWLGNARGTFVSRGHVKWDPDNDRQFWNFSLHEIGYYDVAAYIDYISSVTKHEKLHCIGYSQGAQNFFVLTSERPEYANKIRLITALAPAIYLKDTKSPLLQLIVYLRKYLFMTGDLLNFHEFFDSNGLLSLYLKQICDEESIFVGLCLHNFFMLHGYNMENTNKSLLSVMISNMPAGISFQQVHHLVQLLETGNFQKFDYGLEGNLKQYSRETPPIYDIARINVPIALYYARNDWIVNHLNIERLYRELTNITKVYVVPDNGFNHNDFMYGNDIVELVYQAVIEEILKY